MKLNYCLRVHGTARRPAWNEDAYFYLKDGAIYFSGTKAPAKITLADDDAVDYVKYEAPVRNHAQFVSGPKGKHITRDQLKAAIAKVAKESLLAPGIKFFGDDELCQALGL